MEIENKGKVELKKESEVVKKNTTSVKVKPVDNITKIKDHNESLNNSGSDGKKKREIDPHTERTAEHKLRETHLLDAYKSDTVSRTLMFSVRRSKMNTEKNVEGKRTSFLELFFDLAIIFVFALVASGFAKAWHVDAEQLLGNSHDEIVSSVSISVAYWFVSFMALWITWYQYNVYVRYYGRNNLSTHVVTFLLIIGVIAQGMARIVSYRWFHIYALSFSFIFNRFILMLWMWISIDKKPSDIAEKYRLSVLIKQTWAFLGYFLVFTAFIMCVAFNIIVKPDSVDLTWVYLWVSVFLLIAISLELGFEFISKYNNNKKVNQYESVIFHNKERHHLFLIITFGELLVINLSTGTEFVNLYGTLLPSLAINLIITMIIWYIYKTFVFAPEYKLNYRNRVVFTFLHILVIGSLTVILSSLETYSIAIHELKSVELGDGFNIGLIDLQVAVDIVYPLIFLIGYIMLILSITLIVLLAEHKPGAFENAIKHVKFKFVGWMTIPILVSLTIMILVMVGIRIDWIWIESIVLASTAIGMVISLFSVNRYLLNHNKPEVVEELLEEIHG